MDSVKKSITVTVDAVAIGSIKNGRLKCTGQFSNVEEACEFLRLVVRQAEEETK